MSRKLTLLMKQDSFPINRKDKIRTESSQILGLGAHVRHPYNMSFWPNALTFLAIKAWIYDLSKVIRGTPNVLKSPGPSVREISALRLLYER